MKQTKKDRIDQIEIYTLDGNIDTVVEKLLAYKFHNKKEYDSIVLSVENVDKCDNCGGYEYLAVYGMREETDEEYARRLNQEEKLRVMKEKQEKALIKQLEKERETIEKRLSALSKKEITTVKYRGY